MPVYSIRMPVKEISSFQKRFNEVMLQIPKLKGVIGIEGDNEHKKMLIKKKTKELEEYLEEKKWEIKEDSVQLTYEHFTTSKNQQYLIILLGEILKELLPPDLDEIPSGFETVGDIAHMNLLGKQLDHRYIIGQVVLDKNPSLRTVVTKLG